MNNKKAMDILAMLDSTSSSPAKDSAAEALIKLKQAVAVLEATQNKELVQYKRLMAISLNNIACYYKRFVGTNISNRFEKPNVALQYLDSVLAIELSINQQSDISTARTHLNICAIESSLGKHKVALTHAQKALEIARICCKNEANAGKDLSATLAIAFYNVGTELEHLKNYKEAYEICQVGVDMCGKLLGSQHVLCEKLAESLVEIGKNKEVRLGITKRNRRRNDV